MVLDGLPGLCGLKCDSVSACGLLLYLCSYKLVGSATVMVPEILVGAAQHHYQNDTKQFFIILCDQKEYIDMNEKGSTSAQIIYHYSTSPESIPGIVIYIFTTGKVQHGQVLLTHTIEGEVHHSQYSTHNRGKSQDKRYINNK